MKTTSCYITALIVGALLSSGMVAARAAKVPLTKEQLENQAGHVVKGKVVKVTSKTKRSQVEKATGLHRDRVFTITILVDSVSKGAGIKPGDRITVMAWQPSVRIPPLPGLQGHEGIPDKGDTATFYLKRNDDKTYEPLLPNGITVAAKKTDARPK